MQIKLTPVADVDHDARIGTGDGAIVLCAWAASANAGLDCRNYVIEQNSSAQCAASREVVITTCKNRYN